MLYTDLILALLWMSEISLPFWFYSVESSVPLWIQETSFIWVDAQIGIIEGAALRLSTDVFRHSSTPTLKMWPIHSCHRAFTGEAPKSDSSPWHSQTACFPHLHLPLTYTLVCGDLYTPMWVRVRVRLGSFFLLSPE